MILHIPQYLYNLLYCHCCAHAHSMISLIHMDTHTLNYTYTQTPSLGRSKCSITHPCRHRRYPDNSVFHHTQTFQEGQTNAKVFVWEKGGFRIILLKTDLRWNADVRSESFLSPLSL